MRAWSGGTGGYKLGANYVGPTLIADEAQQQGYAQVLWLFGEKNEVTEVGAMNCFLVFRDAQGVIEVATAPLSDGYILPGVTRDSILALLRRHIEGKATIEGLPPREQLKVTERKIYMQEVIDTQAAGQLVESFGAGTAAIIAPIDRIGFRGTDYPIPVGKDGFGDIARVLLRELVGRQVGAIDEKGWSHIC